MAVSDKNLQFEMM